MSNELNDDIIETACRMAQDLQEYVDEGEANGCYMTATKAVLAEWEEAYKKLNRPWQETIVDDGELPGGLLS